MSLRLVIEHSTHPQPLREMRHQGGDLSIGRGNDCDWPLDDPEMFISRRHCVITVRDGAYLVTDASRGGLYVDGSDRPLGAGNTAPLDHGMRLRMGDVVIRVEIEAGAQASVGTRSAVPSDDFFSTPVEVPAPRPRPGNLPEPFDTGRPSEGVSSPPPRTPGPPIFDDPFTLDPVRRVSATAAEPRQPATSSTDSFWSEPADDAPTSARDTKPPGAAAPADFAFDDFFDAPAVSAPAVSARAGTPTAALSPKPQPTHDPVADQAGTPAPAEVAVQPAASPAAKPDADLFLAFLKGAGLAAAPPGLTGTADDIEQLGRRFRLLAEGLVHLLRARAREKGSARLAQTVIGSVDVNPLKFLPSTEEALAALIVPRGKGYLAPDDAITNAYRDISDHQMRSWIAIQSALRRMIDRFDPAAFEAEVDKAGSMKSLLAGGRGARLWQLYAERYREIAKSAEDRFLGEVGADFRDAYEGKRRTDND